MELSSDQERTMAAFIASHNGGEPDWYLGEDVALTLDALDQFDGRNWREACGREDSLQDGCPARLFDSVQTRKGEPRVTLYVIDFGEFRAAFMM